MNKKKKDKAKKVLKVAGAVTAASTVALAALAVKKLPNSRYANNPEEKNPYEGMQVKFICDEKAPENADGVKGYLKPTGSLTYKTSFYDKYVKRALDILVSATGLIVLAPVFAGISVAIQIDDPGTVLFCQKRVGKNKQYFKLHKFRSMKTNTPKNIPTHMMKNPDEYITKVGKFLRAHSLDELPQIWDIFIGNMSVVGPRPGLWNQDLLTAERDKYDVSRVRPGLTGWAQINGRDELEIPVKAKYDGEYVTNQSLKMDAICFAGSAGKIASDDAVVEGGTGSIHFVKPEFTKELTDKEIIGNIGFKEHVSVDKNLKTKVLITGKCSYIGNSFIDYAKKYYSKNFVIDAISVHGDKWREYDFSKYDIVYHVAGLAHADVGNVTDAVKKKYYEVNTNLAIQVCNKAKTDGVKQFIFMSSMIVYGDSAPIGQSKIIDKNTVPAPANFYGDSKLQADIAIRKLANNNFKVIVLRPPMIYGKDSKGNFPMLIKLANILPAFPIIDNKRSMLYIENLCEFLCQIMLADIKQKTTVLTPQNVEYANTSNIVKLIAQAKAKNLHTSGCILPLLVKLANRIPGKIHDLVNKAFGSLCYDLAISSYSGIKYQKYTLDESIKRSL